MRSVGVCECEKRLDCFDGWMDELIGRPLGDSASVTYPHIIGINVFRFVIVALPLEHYTRLRKRNHVGVAAVPQFEVGVESSSAAMLLLFREKAGRDGQRSVL